ncbi:MAG: hypothetical protein WEB52_10650 [Dehalococcoidia bacterium]
MTKIQLKLGIAIAAAALMVVGGPAAGGVVRAGERTRFPQPEEWTAVMDYLEAIAANETRAPATSPDAAPAEAPIESAPVAPPAAHVEAPAVPAAVIDTAAPAPAVQLPNAGTGGESPALPMTIGLLALSGVAIVGAAPALRIARASV